MGPSLSVDQTAAVELEEGCAGALLAAEAERAVGEAVDEPFEADGDLQHLAADAGGDAVDHAAGDERLADGRVLAPVGRFSKRYSMATAR